VRDPIRVLIVDDSAFIRRAVERMLGAEPELRVCGSATNGAEAVEQVHRLKPDVVLMDVNMPEMDGLEALERIMAELPTKVVLMSTLTRAGAEVTLRALEMGAVDFIDKSAVDSAMDIYALAPVIRRTVLAVARAGEAALPDESTEQQTEHAQARLPDALPPAGPAPHEAVLIGTSTGGPRALSVITCALPADFPVGIVIAQHMPGGFTTTLADRLNRESPLEVREACDGDVVRPGRVLVVPGGQQATLARIRGELRLRIHAGDPDLLYRPSVDLLFASAAEVLGARCVAVVLTGMGHDGADGLRRLREAGARTLVESAETALIDGMPRAARPAAEAVVRLEQIPARLIELCSPSPAARERA
jgi:two-component system, chemotaxis family, protein-glutamate methylesterase/glutaminase